MKNDPIYRPDNLWYKENMKKTAKSPDGQGLDKRLNRVPLAMPFDSFPCDETGAGYGDFERVGEDQDYK